MYKLHIESMIILIFSNYILILTKIIRNDIFTFLVVFAFILLATTGGLYIEERRLTVPSANSTLP